MMMMVIMVVMVINGDDELTLHSNMCMNGRARRAINWTAIWPTNWTATLGSTTGQHHWPALITPLSNSTGHHHWPAPLAGIIGQDTLATCSKHVDDDDDDDDESEHDDDDYDDDDDAHSEHQHFVGEHACITGATQRARPPNANPY
jgi:hypothetical protein